MITLDLPYGDTILPVRLPRKRLLAVGTPCPVEHLPEPAAETRRALENPVGAPRLASLARGARSVMILIDDLTRQTPVALFLPLVLEELHHAGLCDDQVTVNIALGTHRPMTEAEIITRVGAEIWRRVRVINNPWDDPAQMRDLGLTPNGSPVSVSAAALDTDLLIGLGSIVPHHIPGFSGGGKIVQPGITGAATTGATHFLSTRAEVSYLGQVENPVRAEIDAIAARVGLRAILNAVLDSSGNLVRAFYGDPVQAHRAGTALARQVYGVPLPGKAEIVLAGSHPCDIEFWQAHKSLYPAEMAVQKGGTIIVVTPCPEGVSVTHTDLLEFTALDAEQIEHSVVDGTIPDVVSGALALAWAKVRRSARVSMVSQGISAEAARALGFQPFDSVEDALAEALQRHGADARINVLTHAPDSLPLLPGG